MISPCQDILSSGVLFNHGLLLAHLSARCYDGQRSRYLRAHGTDRENTNLL